MSTFTTEALKKLVSYAIKGAGLNSKIELSTYIGITISNGKLTLSTTDGENFLSVSDSCLADDMDITVDAETFSKLIGKLNSDTVDLEVVDNALVVTGNGKYTLELIPDENGNRLSFPNKFPDSTTDIGKITAADLLCVNSTIKASLSNVVGSIYSAYYFGDVVASTDRAMMSIFNRRLLDNSYIFNSQFVDLMCMSGVDVSLAMADNIVVAKAIINDKSAIQICTKLSANPSEFKIENITKFGALEINSFCRFRKAQMLDLLDRLSLFVKKFDEGAIQLEFTKTGINVSSLASSGVEFIEYQECKNAESCVVKINIDRFRNQLKAYSSDMVDLYYGSDLCVKLVDGDISQIIALIR